MKMRKQILACALTVSALVTIPAAKATPVTGSANILGNVSVSGSSIDFVSNFAGSFGALQTGDFQGLTGGVIKSLTNGPATGATFVESFVSFTTGLASPVYFDLTYVAPGVGSLADCSSSALGAVCTPQGSPFTLFQLPSNTVIAALQLNGNLYMDSRDSGQSTAASIFTTQTVVNGTIPEIVSLLSSGQTLTGITYSASFIASSPVPEPTYFPLWSIGLLATGLLMLPKNRS